MISSRRSFLFQSLALAASGLIPAPAFSLAREVIVPQDVFLRLAQPIPLEIEAIPGKVIELMNHWNHSSGGSLVTTSYYIGADNNRWFRLEGGVIRRKEYPLLEKASSLVKPVKDFPYLIQLEDFTGKVVPIHLRNLKLIHDSKVHIVFQEPD